MPYGASRPRLAHGDTFHNDRYPDLKADYILANPHFNDSDWGGRAIAGRPALAATASPPKGNANFAWVQHFLHHLSPRGIAGFVLANGSMSSNQSGEGQIRKNLIEADLVDCIVALPGQLFRSTQIPACLWFLCAADGAEGVRRDRRHQTLFIDSRKLGHMLDRTRIATSPKRTLPALPAPTTLGEDRLPVRPIPLSSREEGQGEPYADVPGFCKSAALDEVSKHGHVLTPGRYVGAAPHPDDGEPFEQKMARLASQWRRQQAEARRLDAAIEA